MSVAQNFGVYVHWPFCAAKCPYCDFNSHVGHRPIDEAQFLTAYKAEIAHWARTLGADKPALSSVFFGGGTPSLMSPQLVAGILEALEQVWGFALGIEISLEANPQSVDAGNFKDLASVGVNRLSIGVQSFDDVALKALGRLHDSAQAKQAIEIAQTHFDRFSFDMIYARPDQSLMAWRTELAEAFAFGPSHLSLYQLTIEPNTAYKRLYDAGLLVMPSEDMAADFYELTQELCSDAGLPAYEVSNHAVAGSEARHNLLYWQYGDFIGIGPGAHGRVSIEGQRFGTQTEALPQAWLSRVDKSGHGIIEQLLIDPSCQAREILLMGMRLRAGLSLTDMEVRTGFTVLSDVIEGLERDGLLVDNTFHNNSRLLATTDKGMALLNHVAGRLVEGVADISDF